MLKWIYGRCLLYLLNSVICHVGFYKTGIKINTLLHLDSLFPSPSLSSISFSLPTNSISNLPPATGTLTHGRLLRRKGCQQGGCSKQAPCMGQRPANAGRIFHPKALSSFTHQAFSALGTCCQRKEDRHKEDFYLALTSEGSEQVKSMFMGQTSRWLRYSL